MCPLDYYVIEGEGSFAVGKRRATLGPGAVAWRPPVLAASTDDPSDCPVNSC